MEEYGYQLTQLNAVLSRSCPKGQFHKFHGTVHSRFGLRRKWRPLSHVFGGIKFAISSVECGNTFKLVEYSNFEMHNHSTGLRLIIIAPFYNYILTSKDF